MLTCRAFADSKTLTEAKRDQLFAEMQTAEDVGYAVDVVPAAEISAQMLRRYAICLAILYERVHRKYWHRIELV